jgi:hypothetical protein
MKRIFTINGKLLRTALLPLLLLLGALPSRAVHIAAVDLYINYIGTPGTADSFKYEIILQVYKACEKSNTGTPLGSAYDITYFTSSGCGAGGTIKVNTPVIDTLDKLCDTFKAKNSCRNPDDYRLSSVILSGVRSTCLKVVRTGYLNGLIAAVTGRSGT